MSKQNESEEVMETSMHWVEEAMKTLPDKQNDSQLAKALGISRQALSLIRSNRHAMSVLTAVKIAETLKTNPMRVISSAMYEQKKDEDEKAYWARINQLAIKEEKKGHSFWGKLKKPKP